MSVGERPPTRPAARVPDHGNRLPSGLQARLREAPPRVLRNFNRHVKADDGTFVLDQIICRLCAAPLWTWRELTSFERRQRKVATTPPTVVQEIRLGFLPTADYDDLEIETEQVVGVNPNTGAPIVVLGKHTTVICKTCKPTVPDALADDLYVTDLEQMAINDAAARKPIERTQRVLSLLSGFRGRRILRGEE